MTEYNYDRFSTSHYTLDNFQGPAVGRKAQDFPMQTTDGARRQLLDFAGDFLVLEIGSITCPLYQSRRGKMKTLTDDYPHTSFAIMYVREAHPGEARSKHEDAEGKLANARALQFEDGEGRTILIDDLEGHAHVAYGSFPNAVFIINKKHCVVYYSDWNNPTATGRALVNLKAGKPAPGMGMFLPATPSIGIATLKNAGEGAGMDFLQGLPRLFWENLVKRNLRVLFRRPQPISPDMNC
ncbi:hypothetical protein A9Q96_08830 [Rhodobacterales bacterium 52_120_T64]|nr:hypothetical protein A9Q96_08830 [Rhodobacterales bacterium 52_120_T64]